MVIETENTLSHSSPWGEDFPGLNKSAWLLTQHTRSMLTQAQHPATGFRDHIPLEAGLIQKLLFCRSELPQPSTCCNQLERVASSCTNTHSCAHLQKDTMRYLILFVWSLGLRRIDQHMDPEPVSLISGTPQQKMGPLLSFLHHPHKSKNCTFQAGLMWVPATL